MKTNRTADKQPIVGPHLVRFGTAGDQKFLLGKFLSAYDQLIVNANILVHMPSALASFLTIKARDKEYFIDPQTHAFQHDIKNITSEKTARIKRSVAKLIDVFGDPIDTAINKEGRAIEPKDFAQREIVKGFCHRVLSFQKSAISKETRESDAAKYYDFIQKEKGAISERQFEPTFVVAPYFYLTRNFFDAWLKINIKCVQASEPIARKERMVLAAQIVISRDLLCDHDKMQRLVDTYKEVKVDIFLVWIDSFVEQEATKEELCAYIDLITELGRKAAVVNLYGGYLSVVLVQAKRIDNFIGVAHGLEYGESRGVAPVGGGMPSAKYYLPSLHARLLFRDALRAIRSLGALQDAQVFYKNICDCSLCKKIIRTNPASEFMEYGKTQSATFQRAGQQVTTEHPLGETRNKTVEHYMWCKKKEYRESSSIDNVVKELRQTYKNLNRALSSEYVDHVNVWADVLEDK